MNKGFLFASSPFEMVEISGIEPLTSWMPFRVPLPHLQPLRGFGGCECTQPLILKDFSAYAFFKWTDNRLDFSVLCALELPTFILPYMPLESNSFSMAFYVLVQVNTSF